MSVNLCLHFKRFEGKISKSYNVPYNSTFTYIYSHLLYKICLDFRLNPETIKITSANNENIIPSYKLIRKNGTLYFYVSEYDECPVCYEHTYYGIKPYDCNHVICENCFLLWEQRQSTCPLCRQSILLMK